MSVLDKLDKKVIAVLPAYNAEKTLLQTVEKIPQDFVDEIILVDDASRDKTAELALKMGLTVFKHEKNLGYGGNQKTCYREALARGADIVIMIHPDHQYDPKFVPAMLNPIIQGEVDAVFGSRMMIKANALKGGMPVWKFFGNIMLTQIGNIMLGTKLTEFHSGFRAYSAKFLRSIDLQKNSDDFVFDTEIIIQLVSGGFKIKEIPISTRYFEDASSIGIKKSVRYASSFIVSLCRDKFTRA